jgi:hypothetical protein
MRKSITILIVIIAAAALFTLFKLASFEADQPEPFVFAEPKLPEGATPDQVINAPTEAENDLTPEQKQQKAMAVSQLESALALYKGYEKNVPPQAAATISALSQMVLEGKLPGQFLSVKEAGSPLRVFEVLKLSPQNSQIEEGKEEASSISSLSCLDKTPLGAILVGNENDNELVCDLLGLDPARRPTEDRLFLGGPGNDRIQDTVGNRLINGGSGDDQISVGSGRTLIFLEAGWGKDTLTVDCVGAEVSPSEIPSGFPIPWTYKYSNFIVLGPGINGTDVAWDGLALKNTSTGDSLTVTQNCFNVVSLSQ